jgi:hypothetical protein
MLLCFAADENAMQSPGGDFSKLPTDDRGDTWQRLFKVRQDAVGLDE